MGRFRSFILASLLIYFYVLQGAVGIEFLFSQDDMGIGSYYDVDDSVAVNEEASAAYGSGITDSREVSGKGHIYADQQFTASSYRGFVNAHGSAGGSVKGSAVMTPTDLYTGQSASLSGRDVYAYMEGWQGYRGSEAATVQDAAVQGSPSELGYLNTRQTMCLGSNIYSAQNTQANGFNSYALGAAGVLQEHNGLGQIKGQGALAGVASLGDPDGSVHADLNAEVVKTPVCIDPAANGGIKAKSNAIAFGGALAGNLKTDIVKGKIDVQGATALTGVLGGELEADVGAQTEQSHSAWVDGWSLGVVALQAAAAGDLNANLAEQKAEASGALVAAGAAIGGVSGSMSAVANKNRAKVQGESVQAGGLLAGAGTAAGDIDVKWKNNLKIGAEGSAVGAGAGVGIVKAEEMSARISNKGTKARIDGLSALGLGVGLGAIACYKPINGQLSTADVYSLSTADISSGPLSLTNGKLVAKTGWTDKGYRLKAAGKFDADNAGGIAVAETNGPGPDDYDSDGFVGFGNHVDTTAKKFLGGKGKADVEVS